MSNNGSLLRELNDWVEALRVKAEQAAPDFQPKTKPVPTPKRGKPSTRIAARNNAKTRIAMERERQIELWGNDPMPLAMRLAILTEEVGEVARAMQDEGDARLLEELVQVGAVALRWAEDLLLEMDR